MNVSTQIRIERSSILSVAEALQVMLEFGSFIITLLTFVIALILFRDKK